MRGIQQQDLQDAIRELDFLQRLAQEAATAQKPGELVDLVIRETTSAMATDVCSLYLSEPGGDELKLAATNGLNPLMVGRAHLRFGSGITGWVAQHREHLAVPDVGADARVKWIPGVDQKRFRSMLSVPIEAGDRLVGVLNVQSAERRDFVAADVDFLKAIAGQVAGILERMELQRRLEAQLAEIRLSHEIHGRFTQLSLDGAGIPAILDAVGSLAGGRAGLYSIDGFRVRSGVEEGDALPARLTLPPDLLRGHGPPAGRVRGGLDDAEAERLARQAERLGHRLPGRAWVVVLEPDDAASEAEMAARGRQDRIHV